MIIKACHKLPTGTQGCNNHAARFFYLYSNKKIDISLHSINKILQLQVYQEAIKIYLESHASDKLYYTTGIFWEAIKPRMERNRMEPIGTRTSFNFSFAQF